jgi:hypothetical protein
MSAPAQAGTVTIPLNPAAKRPANDLVDTQGQPIDESEAGHLLSQGVELWRLNPQPSQLWKDEWLEASNEEAQGYPADGATVYFDSNLASVKGLFRASVDAPAAPGAAHPRPRSFTLTVSLSNSAALMRAALLRKIGYQVSNPKIYRSLKIKFASVAARDQFLNDLADGSLTSRKRWVVGDDSLGGDESKSESIGAPKDKPEATLQGVVLEPGRINVQTVHWGLMSQALQQDRRVFRALVIPDVLVDFNEKVNAFAWDPARVFNNTIQLEYLFAAGFNDVALDDAKWALARVGRLSRADFADIVARAGLPADISALLVEKVIARRNALAKVFRLAGPTGSGGAGLPLLGYNPRLSVGNVVQGQLTRDDYKGQPAEFYADPAKPPLRFSQLWRYGAIESISAGIGGALGWINSELLTLASSSSAMEEHQKKLSQGLSDHLIKTGSLTGFQKTAGIWGAPIAGANVNASRTVVAGTYLGSDSQVQMVDTMAVSVNAGYYLGWDGAAPIATPSVTTGVNLIRSYSHVRPVQDMSTALKTNWGRLVTVSFMRGLANTLNPDIQCTIPETAWKSESEIEGVKFIKIHYDDKKPGGKGKEEALALRSKLIAEGADADRIILQPSDRKADCKAEIEKGVDKNLTDFAEDLAVGETFVITDAVELSASQQINIPITVLAGMFDVAVAPNAKQAYLVQRQTLIKKVEGGFQVYLQDNRMESLAFGLDLNFYVNVFKASRERQRGHATAEFYDIPTEGANADS